MKINWTREGRSLAAYFGRCWMRLAADGRVSGGFPGRLTEKEENAKERVLSRFEEIRAENQGKEQESVIARMESSSSLTPVFPEGLITIFYPEDGEGEKAFCVVYLGWKDYSFFRVIPKMPGKPEEEVRSVVRQFFHETILELFTKVAKDETEKLLQKSEAEYVKQLRW